MSISTYFSNLNIFSISALIGISFFSSCAYQLDPVETEQRSFYYHNIKSTLVVPFLDYTGNAHLSNKVHEIFTTELARFSEISVIHSDTIKEYLKEEGITIDAQNLMSIARELAEVFGTQSIIIGAITEFNTYYPPKLGLSFEVIDVHRNEQIVKVSETYDANFNYVRTALQRYTGLRHTKDSAFGLDLYLRKENDYIRFVSHELIRKYL